MNKKSLLVLIIDILLLLGNIALIIYNAIVTYSDKEINETFAIAIAFVTVGVIGLILLIKPLFSKFYIRFLPTAEKAEEWSQGRIVSEKKAYCALAIANFVIFMLALLLQVLAIFIK